MGAEESQFLNEVVTLLSTKSHDQLKLVNIAAILDGSNVLMSDAIKSVFKKTTFVTKYGMKAAIALFQQKMVTHLTQAFENGVTHFPSTPIMLTSISSVPIFANVPVSNLPGSTYHRDGRGKPITTKITQTETRKWHGGELHLAYYQPDSEYIGNNTISFPGEDVVTLNRHQSIIFNNQKLLHAVNPYITTTVTTRRTIYQERMNLIDSFDLAILLQFSPLPIPAPSVSLLSTYLHSFINPVILAKRDRQLDEMSKEEQQYIANNETPHTTIRSRLIEKHGSDFQSLAQQLDDNGLLIMPELLTGETLQLLQVGFQKQIDQKPTDKHLKQTSFNATVDKIDKKLNETVAKLAEHKPLQALIQHYLGQENIALASWRGYRQEPRSSMHYRAWDWHNDQKALGAYGELKIMILLTDLDKDGQAMRVMQGSQKKHWFMPTQKFSKYHFDEALSYSKDTPTLCYGKAGTVILFDTNIIHSGFRNLSERRDVITINFVPALKNSPIMFSDQQLIMNSLKDQTVSSTVWAQLRRSTVTTEQTLSPDETAHMREAYYTTPKFEDAKTHFAFENDHINFVDFVKNAIQADLAADLDIAIRYGAHDVERDKQMVFFRDAGLKHPIFLNLHDKLALKNISIDYNIDLSQAQTYIAFVLNNSAIQQFSKKDVSIHRTLKLLNNLFDAISCNDTLQRLRTNLIYTYFCLEHIFATLPTEKENLFTFFSKELNNETRQAIHHHTDSVLDMYISAIYLDDLNLSLKMKN